MNTIGKNSMSTPIPIVVDLDGTLIHTDMLHESVLKLLGSSPINLLRVPYWLMQGKAVLKKRLADLMDFDPSLLPYNQELLEWLKARKAEGHKLILCTASDGGIAAALSEHLGIFDEVMALPYHIYVLATAGTNIEATRPIQFGTVLVLVTVVLSIDMIAIIIRSYMRKNKRW